MKRKNKQLFLSALIFVSGISAFAQVKTPEDFGFRHIVYRHKNDKVDILIKSKKGEENVPKPLFFFCQGSLPRPLIKYDEKGAYGVFPFSTDTLSEKYHLVIVGKPYIPVMADIKTLHNNNCLDERGKFPREYSDRNLPNYYVRRNIAVIKFLQKQKGVSKVRLVVAGHSEGSTVAAKMAVECKKITYLIYASGSMMGRIMSIIGQSRAAESDTDSTRFGEKSIADWENAVKNKNSMDDSRGDTDKATFDFSYPPPIEYLEKLKIPVMVSYGTKDWCAPFNDYLRVKTIRQGKQNFTFKAYIGAEHNYFPLTKENTPNCDIFGWDKVVSDWLKWLNGMEL